jgi:hypothetical protein
VRASESAFPAVPANVIFPPLPTLFPESPGVCEAQVGAWFFVITQERFAEVNPFEAVTVSVFVVGPFVSWEESTVMSGEVAPPIGVPFSDHTILQEASFGVPRKFREAFGFAEIFAVADDGFDVAI